MNQEYRDLELSEAKTQGLQVVLPALNELQIDVDSEEAYERCLQMFLWLQDEFCAKMKEAPSRSGLPKRHVTITLDDHCLTDIERIALQAICGSDHKREFMGYLRIRAGIAPVTAFFEKETP